MEWTYQTPEFEEYTYIIRGKKQFIIEDETIILEAGQSIKIEKNTRVQYSNPFDQNVNTLPAFDFTKVHRESKSIKKNLIYWLSWFFV
jgi:ethanolamine utilization protein EutQ (cupin superfamily)